MAASPEHVMNTYEEVRKRTEAETEEIDHISELAI